MWRNADALPATASASPTSTPPRSPSTAQRSASSGARSPAHTATEVRWIAAALLCCSETDFDDARARSQVWSALSSARTCRPSPSATPSASCCTPARSKLDSSSTRTGLPSPGSPARFPRRIYTTGNPPLSTALCTRLQLGLTFEDELRAGSPWERRSCRKGTSCCLQVQVVVTANEITTWLRQSRCRFCSSLRRQRAFSIVKISLVFLRRNLCDPLVSRCSSALSSTIIDAFARIPHLALE